LSKPEDKKIVSKKRQRNFIAKKMKEEPRFHQKRIEDKRKDVDPLDDYSYLDRWLTTTGEE
jgi:hypothetical protein